MSDGRYVTAEYPVATRIVLFRPDGRLDRVVGRRGEGPGEFQFITAAYIDHDNRLRIVDVGLRRETVFDDTLGIVDIVRIPELMVHSVASGPDGSVYYNADRRTSEAVGLPIHTIAGGSVTNSFGDETAIQRPDAPWLGQRAMAPVDGGVWIARRTHYRLEHWTVDGQRLAAMDRNASWFEPYLMRAPITPGAPPQPWVTALQMTRDGVLLVVVTVPASDFPQRLDVLERRPDNVVYDLGDCSAFSDTLIEAIDPLRHKVLWSWRYKGCLDGLLGDMAYGYRIDDRGVPRIDVFRLTLPLVEPIDKP
ncbi:MAG TPA: 6-bladed beta-propeller [Longimicrobiales bacterium]|nr:6-bladed beta-propeller [Longimicrobiales bacterium]